MLDLSMPVLTGDQATVRLRRNHPGLKVLALTVHEDGAYLRQLLQAGATGYVLKRAAGDELIRAIRAVAIGGAYIDTRVAAGLLAFMDPKAQRGPAGAELSAREVR